MKITVGEAIARWLVAQEIELDNGKIVPYFAGVMSIFGHRSEEHTSELQSH